MLAPLLLAACGGSGPTAAEKLRAKEAHEPPQTIYTHGIEALRARLYKTAVDQFNLVEQRYPYSSWATNAQLMHGYAEYLQNHYTPAIGALDRFIQLHPANKDVAYAYYLRSLCFYEQIDDVHRDQTATHAAIAAMQEVINRFPDSAYARDAKLKIDLANDHLAGHQMAIGRYYERQRLYAAALGRYQIVVNNYQTTNHVAEALERMVECYLKLGLKNEARHTAAVLAYNYPGSHWYKDAYNRVLADGLVPGKDVPPPKASGGLLSDTFGWLF